MKWGKLKKTLKSKRPTLGSWITLPDTCIAEIMANAGFEWLVVDMEHSSIDISQAQKLIQTIDLAGRVPLARVGANDPLIIKRVMDAGAQGVIVPMVNTREDAEKAVEAVKYPPYGKRGVGLARAQGYGFDFDEYRELVNANSTVIVQIEHINAVENLEKILGVKGVDGFIIGPYDLSGSMGKPGRFEDPEVKKALRAVKKLMGRTGKSPGFHVVPPDSKMVDRRISEGYRFIAFSLDTVLLGAACRQCLSGVSGKQMKGKR
ncbi:MAG: 2,4-dihydroxyhept-2-ene-1,7-dioic acid aldolase [Candidatus Omnitrophica bacterium]|nr:2,4-dihydroxyhept-2-ene-1,7-dioic acid aldolase [Candidatus Omnitrophota bacterium]